MADYNYYGPGITSAGNDIATGFGRLFIKMQQDKKDHETVQAMLDSGQADAGSRYADRETEELFQ